MDLQQRISVLDEKIKAFKAQRKTQCSSGDESEYQDQLELRWHIQELEDELDDLLLKNRAEEAIEGWG
jgi:hypothetical protein